MGTMLIKKHRRAARGPGQPAAAAEALRWAEARLGGG